MYCPNCGQQQVSIDMKFCSRCGLPITGLAEWIRSRGMVAVQEEPRVKPPSLRRKRIRRGGKLMFWSLVITPLFIFISAIGEEAFPLIVPFFLFLAGLVTMLYAVIFSEDIPPVTSQPVQPARFGPAYEGPALPPASHMQTNTLGQRKVRTAELVEPPSVTENTTRLLDRD